MAGLDPRNGELLRGAPASWAGALVAGERGDLLYASALAGRVGRLAAGEGLRLSPLWRAGNVAGAAAVDLGGDGVDALAVVSARLCAA